METVLLGQAGGTREPDLLERLLRNRWRSGRHRRWRDGVQPVWMTVLWKTASVHLRRILGAVVDVVLRRDARCGVRDLYCRGLVMLLVDGGVT